jgi:hypothetical protein
MPAEGKTTLDEFIFEPRVPVRAVTMGHRLKMSERQQSQPVILNKFEVPRGGLLTLQARYMAGP